MPKKGGEGTKPALVGLTYTELTIDALHQHAIVIPASCKRAIGSAQSKQAEHGEHECSCLPNLSTPTPLP